MHIRSLLALGICAAIGVSVPAYAETTPAKTSLSSSKAKAAEANSNDEKLLKKKRTAGKAEPEKARKAVANSSEMTTGAISDPTTITQTGNSGELRSEGDGRPQGGFLSMLFGGDPSAPNMLPQTRALDAVLEQRQARKQFKVKPAFEPQEVAFSGYERGTIVIDTKSRYLYLVESSGTARRYAIAVGREGLEFKGKATVGDKQEWPRWIPTQDMQKREPKKYGQYKDGMNGGPDNPLGARAIYLYQGKSDTHIRIHGTNQPQTIGTNSSNGCFRMVNDHVIDLYGRIKKGAEVVVL